MGEVRRQPQECPRGQNPEKANHKPVEDYEQFLSADSSLNINRISKSCLLVYHNFEYLLPFLQTREKLIIYVLRFISHENWPVNAYLQKLTGERGHIVIIAMTIAVHQVCGVGREMLLCAKEVPGGKSEVAPISLTSLEDDSNGNDA